MLIEPLDEKTLYSTSIMSQKQNNTNRQNVAAPQETFQRVVSHQKTTAQISTSDLDEQTSSIDDEGESENRSILKAYNGKDRTLTRSFSLLSRNTKSEFSLFENSSFASSSSSTGTNLSRNIDQFGFVFDKFTISSTSYSERGKSPESSSVSHLHIQRQVKQLRKWEELLLKLNSLPTNDWLRKTRLKKYLFAGIPDTLRKRAWIVMLKANNNNNNHLAGHNKEQAKEFPVYLIDNYFHGISGFERQIDVDIVRTLRDHVLYKDRYSVGQQKLFKLLVAFANLFPAIGYCQGMSTMAGVLLIYFEEEQAFNMMIRLFEQRSLSLLYKHGFPLLFELFHIQHELMQKFAPKVWTHLSKHSISSNLFATKWYLSMFLCFPFSIAMRLWDLFFLLGTDIFPVFCVAVLSCLQDEVVQLDFDPLLSFLCRPDEIQGLEEDRLFDILHEYWDRTVKSKSRNLKILHQDYHKKQALLLKKDD